MEVLRKKIYFDIDNKKDKDQASRQIYNQIIKMDAYNKAKTVLCYASLKNEVDTTHIIDDALKKNKTVGLPITKKNLTFIAINNDTVYKIGAFGVREPVCGKEIQNFDLVIVPMVAFDRDCNRMGHGKGYYDKFLADKNCLKIGIAFSEQQSSFKFFPHDIAMDVVITEKDVLIRDS